MSRGSGQAREGEIKTHLDRAQENAVAWKREALARIEALKKEKKADEVIRALKERARAIEEASEDFYSRYKSASEDTRMAVSEFNAIMARGEMDYEIFANVLSAFKSIDAGLLRMTDIFAEVRSKYARLRDGVEGLFEEAKSVVDMSGVAGAMDELGKKLGDSVQVEQIINEGVSPDKVRLEFQTALSTAEENLPISEAIGIPKPTPPPNEDRLFVAFVREPPEGSFHVKANNRLSPIIDYTRILSREGGSYLISKTDALRVEAWKKSGRASELAISDVFGNRIAISANEFGLRLSIGSREGEFDHPLTLMRRALFMAAQENSSEAELLWRLATQDALAGEGEKGRLFRDLLATLARADSTATPDDARGLVRKWAMANHAALKPIAPRLFALASGGQAAGKPHSESRRPPSVHPRAYTEGEHTEHAGLYERLIDYPNEAQLLISDGGKRDHVVGYLDRGVAEVFVKDQTPSVRAWTPGGMITVRQSLLEKTGGRFALSPGDERPSSRMRMSAFYRIYADPSLMDLGWLLKEGDFFDRYGMALLAPVLRTPPGLKPTVTLHEIQERAVKIWKEPERYAPMFIKPDEVPDSWDAYSPMDRLRITTPELFAARQEMVEASLSALRDGLEVAASEIDVLQTDFISSLLDAVDRFPELSEIVFFDLAVMEEIQAQKLKEYHEMTASWAAVCVALQTEDTTAFVKFHSSPEYMKALRHVLNLPVSSVRAFSTRKLISKLGGSKPGQTLAEVLTGKAKPWLPDIEPAKAEFPARTPEERPPIYGADYGPERHAKVARLFAFVLEHPGTLPIELDRRSFAVDVSQGARAISNGGMLRAYDVEAGGEWRQFSTREAQLLRPGDFIAPDAHPDGLKFACTHFNIFRNPRLMELGWLIEKMDNAALPAGQTRFIERATDSIEFTPAGMRPPVTLHDIQRLAVDIWLGSDGGKKEPSPEFAPLTARPDEALTNAYLAIAQVGPWQLWQIMREIKENPIEGMPSVYDAMIRFPEFATAFALIAVTAEDIPRHLRDKLELGFKDILPLPKDAKQKIGEFFAKFFLEIVSPFLSEALAKEIYPGMTRARWLTGSDECKPRPRTWADVPPDERPTATPRLPDAPDDGIFGDPEKLLPPLVTKGKTDCAQSERSESTGREVEIWINEQLDALQILPRDPIGMERAVAEFRERRATASAGMHRLPRKIRIAAVEQAGQVPATYVRCALTAIASDPSGRLELEMNRYILDRNEREHLYGITITQHAYDFLAANRSAVISSAMAIAMPPMPTPLMGAVLPMPLMV